LLHDTVEDTKSTPAELTENFGKTISGIVMEVTDDKKLDKAERKRLQIEHAGHSSHQAKLVKLPSLGGHFVLRFTCQYDWRRYEDGGKLK